MKTYYTGIPCKHGHLSYRYSADGECSCCVKKRAFAHKSENREHYKVLASKYYAENKGDIKEKSKKYYAENKERAAELKKAWYQKNKPSPRKSSEKPPKKRQTRDDLNRYFRDRRKRDPVFKMASYMRNMLRRVLVRSGQEKVGRTTDALGYSPQDLIASIESKFLHGMTWDNYGQWHIDHIRPLSVMIKEGETSPSILNSLENLQPLWAFDNISKGAKESPG